ncbi:MAG: glucose-1-phosphate adenylyltransferase [Candidatus Omnitrophota bacterium]
MRRLITFIMAGGKGERLMPLTKDRAKPAVPFGGIYRIIDFTLSNCINSGIRRTHILIQYKSISLIRHLRLGWNIFDAQLGEYIDVIPAQQRVGGDWYRGTADAIYQNFYTIEQENPDIILILAGDHIYKMDYLRMVNFHQESGADVTIGVVTMPKDKAGFLGVVQVDKESRVLGFKEKPVHPHTIPQDPKNIYASMGIYVFNRKVLEEELNEDVKKSGSSHDFGRDVIPQMIKNKRRLLAYNFVSPKAGSGVYWRDIGTIDAYYEANMDLIKPDPIFNLHDPEWPIRTYQEQFPPAQALFYPKDNVNNVGLILDSLIAGGSIFSGKVLERSILSYNVALGCGSEVYDSILMEGVRVGESSRIKNAIIDKDVVIPDKMVIGFDKDEDKKRFFITDSGIVVVAKGTKIK